MKKLLLIVLFAIVGTAQAADFDLGAAIQKTLSNANSIIQNGFKKPEAASPKLVLDINKILDSYQEHSTIDSGPEGKRTVVHAAYNKGENWHLIVYVQRTADKWELTDDKIVTVIPSKAQIFNGSSDENEEFPAVECRSGGKSLFAFGFFKQIKKTGSYTSKGSEGLAWTLDQSNKIIPIEAVVECKSI